MRILIAGLLIAWAGLGHAEPRVAIVIDDLGYRWQQDQTVMTLPVEVALAVLPHAPHSKRVAELGRQRGHEIIVHIPMEAGSHHRQEPLALTSDMEHAVFVRVLRATLAKMPHASGVSNHMGSRLTGSRLHMDWLMSELARQRAYYFLDSRTSAATQAEASARRHGVPALARRVFLDHEREPQAVAAAFHRLLRLARQEGYAIAIGHPYPETLALLRRRLPLLTEQGIELVAPSALLKTVPTDAHAGGPASPAQ